MGLSMGYENQRVVFDKLVKKYEEYVRLYKFINHGSIEGITPFDQFYWRMVYWAKYSDRRGFGNPGY